MKLFDSTSLGARITRRRQELGMTQKEFADAVNLSVSFYGHIERGTRVPSLPTIALIANRMHVGIDYLMRDSLEYPCLPKRHFTDRELGIFRQFMEENGQNMDDWFAAVDEPPEDSEEQGE